MTTIVVWNVAKRSRDKLDRLVSLAPDVAVVPECARDDALVADGSMVWVGNNETPTSGLAVLGFNGHKVQIAETADDRAVWTVAVTVTGPTEFGLLAVWADNDRTECKRREGSADPLGPVRLAVRHHARFLRRGPVVVAGDFNHNSCWDEPLRQWNHSYAVADLASLGLLSAYHVDRPCQHGSECEPTFFTSRDQSKSHHVDYCFVPATATIESVEVGTWEEWCQKGMVVGSDHAPLTVRLDLQ